MQIADIPVPGRGGSGCLLGFLPEQSTTALRVSPERISERIVEQIGAGGDFPSRRAGTRVVLPRQGSAAAGAEQIAEITSSGGPHGFHPGQVSTASLLDLFTSMCTCPTLPNWNRRIFATVWKPPPGVKVVWVCERSEEGGSRFDLPPLPPERGSSG